MSAYPWLVYPELMITSPRNITEIFYNTIGISETGGRGDGRHCRQDETRLCLIN